MPKEFDAARIHANQASDALFWDWDPSSGLMSWSGAIERLFATAAAELVITRGAWEARVHPDDRAALERRLDDLSAGKVPHADFAYAVLSRDGSYVRVRDRAFLAPTPPGSRQIIGTLKLLDGAGAPADAAAGDSIVEKLQASEQRFRTFIEFLPLLAWETDADGWINFYNQRWYDYSGTAPAEMAGWGWVRIHDPDDLPRMLKVYRSALHTGKPWEDEFRLRRADGTFRWHLSRAMPMRDEQGRIVRWFGTNTDIHDQKMALVEREQLLRVEKGLRVEAERTNRAKDEFLAMLSHELRSPLSAILGWTELLKRPLDDDARRLPMVRKVEANAQLLARLIGDLLDVSRIIAGKMEIEQTLVDVISPTRAALDAVRQAAQVKAIELTCAMPEGRAKVLGSPERLQQILVNLLDNAVKFSANGGRIVVSIEVAHGWITVRIKDEGEGIDPAFLPNLFTRFMQADASATRRYGGLGLGLAIAYHLVHLHGGTIEAHSEGVGRGATFEVRLPIARAITEAADALGPAAAPTIVTLTGIRILAVDDDPEARDVIVSMLVSCGATVTMVKSVAEAFAALRVERPDVIVSDLSMPEVDGYGLIERLRASPDAELRAIPVIALTALASERERARALTQGFARFVVKPFTVAVVARAISEVVRARVVG